MTSTGYVYAGGTVTGSASLIGTLGNPTQFSTSGNGQDAFLLQADVRGAITMSVQLTGAGDETVQAIAVDPQGAFVFVAGTFVKSMTVATAAVVSGPIYQDDCATCLQSYVLKARFFAPFTTPGHVAESAAC